MTHTDVLRLQRHLNDHGFGPLVEDGIYGPATQKAHEMQLHYVVPAGPLIMPPAAKPWWTSRALIGALATIGLSIAGIFLDVSDVNPKELTDVLVAVSTGIAGLLALYGTIKRKAPIDPTLAAPGVRWGTRRARADARRMQPEPLPSSSDAPEARNSAGFPDGHFWGDS